jgi:hypothetical protein
MAEKMKKILTMPKFSYLDIFCKFLFECVVLPLEFLVFLEQRVPELCGEDEVLLLLLQVQVSRVQFGGRGAGDGGLGGIRQV